MATIGYVTKTGDEFTGKLRTLSINADIQIRRNTNPRGENAPDYLVVADNIAIGTGRDRHSERSNRDYVTLTFRDPIFGTKPVFANLVPDNGQDDPDTFAVVWDDD
ncbi:DUF736 domain-containing protein [Nisaea sediminum]|jgi:uncharacterized protein (DUF736 family)|uniref:DUF736 domain-containing protein n=1 Tax=Nisaea sediminum TaxID=2775867 RepID=UPI001868382A|nr:DUF736 domain-containing protein [Nisaea sediminum]